MTARIALGLFLISLPFLVIIGFVINAMGLWIVVGPLLAAAVAVGAWLVLE